MSPVEFETALRGYCHRRRFQPFLVEFCSGHQMLVPHPEAIGPKAGVYLMRNPDGGYVTFTAVSVARLIDVPHVVTT